jgi:branched-chain amino acid aminotransferase
MAPEPLPIAMIDGTVRAREQAMIPVTDEGVLRGDGAFEVLRLYGGRPFGLAEHLERMARTCEMIELAFPAEAMEQDIHRILAHAGPLDANLRFALTRGGCRIVLVEPLPDWQPVRLGVVRYTPTGVLDGTKTLSYAANMLASRWAKGRGHDEALLVHPGGWLLEGPISSIFLVAGGTVVTPPVDEGILASITRRLVLEVADVEVRRVAEEELARCEEAFMVSSSREVQAVRAIEGRELPAPGPVTGRIAAAYRELVASRLDAVGAPA